MQKAWLFYYSWHFSNLMFNKVNSLCIITTVKFKKEVKK